MLVSAGTPVATGTDLADATPMRNSQYYASTGIPLTSEFAMYAQLYKAQPWVYTLVRKLGTSASRLPLKVFERVSETDRKAARDTPYGELIRRPNPRLGAKLFWLWIFSTEELYGEALALKLRDENGRVRELHPIHPSNMLVRRGETGDLEYAYMSYAGGKLALATFPASEILHFRGYNPENVVRGMSPCEPLRQTLIAEDAMRRGQTALWKNGARPSVLLSHPKEISKGAAERLKAQWDAAHSGVDSWGKTAVLEEGITPTLIQITPEDMQAIEGRRLNREECCAVWDVPPPAVQILDRATFSNITEQMRSLYRETMAPRLDAREDVLATQLAPDFGFTKDLYAEFLMDAVLRGSFEARTAAKAQAIGTGQMTPAEARTDENLPFVPGSDQLLVNAALIPLNIASAAPPTGTDVVPSPQHVKSLSARDGAKLDRRLASVASVDEIDQTALLANLDTDGEDVLGLVKAAQARAVDVLTLRAWIAASIEHDFAEEILA